MVGPATLLPQHVEQLGCTAHTNIEEALDAADIVMGLRLQLERQTAGYIPSMAEYIHSYGITRHRLKRFCKPDVLVMHPGPMNRGVEIASDVADDQNISMISNQVTSGVAIRMALLYLILNAPEKQAKEGV